jgi:hypothetical protein
MGAIGEPPPRWPEDITPLPSSSPCRSVVRDVGRAARILTFKPGRHGEAKVVNRDHVGPNDGGEARSAQRDAEWGG